MRTEDGSLVSDCLDGDPLAFGLLIDKYKASIYAIAYSKLNNFQDAEDITQEVFISAYRKLSTLRRWDSFAKWLYSITINMCRNYLRSESNRPDREHIEDQDLSSLEFKAIESFHDEKIKNVLHDTINSLPKIYQQVLLLHYLGGMTSDEIANSLGISSESVRQRMVRGRELIRKDLIEPMNSVFESKKLKADFTFNIIETIKHINNTPKIINIHWGLSLTSIFIAFAILNALPSFKIMQHDVNENGIFQSRKNIKPLTNENDYAPIQFFYISQNQLSLYDKFDDDDLSDWIGGYYQGEINLDYKKKGNPIVELSNWVNGYYQGEINLDYKKKGNPIVELSSDAAKSGKYGLRFTKDKNYGTSAMLSSPAFGPFLLQKFIAEFDVILFDYKWHMIQLGENATYETNNERTTMCFGIGFDKGIIGLRAEDFPVIGRYNANEFYHVVMVADPLRSVFNVNITGNLIDLDGNHVNEISLDNIKFETPISEKGIRRLNFYTGEPTINSMGIDNLEIKAINEP